MTPVPDGQARKVCNVCRRAMVFRRIHEVEGQAGRDALTTATELALSVEYRIAQARATRHFGTRKKHVAAAFEKTVALFEVLEKAGQEGEVIDG